MSADKNTVYYVKSGSNGLNIILPSSGNSPQDIVRIADINGLLSDTFNITINGELATINNESADLTLDVAHSTTEFEWTGSTWLIRFYGNMTTPELTTKLLLPVSTANMASIKFTEGLDPTTPVEGDLWLSNYDNQLKFRDINSNNITLDGIVGEIKMYSSTTPPVGYLLCNGQILSKTQYQRLYNVVGNSYWDGTTVLTSSQFQLPNFNGRVPVGLNASDTNFATLGKFGGESTHRLTINEMPSHNHSYVSPTSSQNSASGSSTRANTAGATSGNTGGDQAHNNLQPYLVISMIIKY
jgi:microcystin-dependent protein